MKINMNELEILGKDGNEKFKDYSIISKDINVYFRNIKKNLIEQINKSQIVVGCVAWLTDFDILNELSKKPAAIVVQKEDFLRPDVGVNDKNMWKETLKNYYERIGGLNGTHTMGFGMNFACSDGTPFDSVRCVGNYNYEKKPAFPRMHNKFLVFCKMKHIKEVYSDMLEPYAVWTGSFNFTKNAGYSLENAILIKDKKIAEAYYQEFRQIGMISEPLDWESDWSEPEWRVGT